MTDRGVVAAEVAEQGALSDKATEWRICTKEVLAVALGAIKARGDFDMVSEATTVLSANVVSASWSRRSV